MEGKLKRQVLLKTQDQLGLTHYLDTLIAGDYSADSTDVEELTRLVCGVCDMVSVDDDLLVSKCLLLISKAFGRKEVEVGSVLSLGHLVDFTIAAVERHKTWLLEDALCALKVLLCASDKIDNTHIDCLLCDKGILCSLLSDAEMNPNILKLTVQCIGHVCRPRESVAMREACGLSALHCLLRLLQSPPPQVTSDAHQKCKMASACLRALRNVVTANRGLTARNAATLLATLKVYAFFSPSSLVSSASLASELSVPLSAAVSGCAHGERKAHSASSPAARAKKKRKSGKGRPRPNEKERFESGTARRSSAEGDWLPAGIRLGPSWHHPNAATVTLSSRIAALPVSQSVTSASHDHSDPHFSQAASQPCRVITSSSSESELSDSESAQKQRERNAFCQVRVDGLLCLQSVVYMLEKKVMFGYWSSFIPDNASVHGGSPHLLSLISEEGPSKVRIAALSFLMSMLDGSKQFLIAADDSDRPHSAFIPFSVTLGRIIRSLHDCLISVVSSVTASTLVFTLKCLSLLMANSPYNKLQHGYITRIVHSIMPYTSSHDAEVKIVSFTCLGSIVSACSHLDEVESLLVTQRESGNGKKGLPWIVNMCLEQLRKLCKTSVDKAVMWSRIPAVRVEALRVLGLLFINYPSSVRSCWQLILDAVCCCLPDETEFSMKLHYMKLLDKWAKFAACQVGSSGSVDCDLTKEVLSYWNHLLSGPVAILLDVGVSSSAPCCVATIDFLSSIGPQLFDMLPRDKHALIVTSMFRLSSAADNSVKAAAIRAVGVFVTYPCTSADVTFLLDLCDCVINCMSVPALAVRMKAAWSLANLTDNLLSKHSSSDDPECILPSVRIISLFHCAIQGCSDNDKVRTNSLRALGNLSRLMTPAMLGSDPLLLDCGVQALDQAITSGSVKVRWNACYAAGNLFHNSQLLEGTQWAETVLQSLFKAMHDSNNFKVRINAASAAYTVSDRQLYGSNALFDSMWEDVLTALENSDSVDDFSEFKYRDNLQTQLLSLICLLTELCTGDDLSRVTNIVSHRKLALQPHFDRCLQHKLSPSVSQHVSMKETGTAAGAEDLAARVSTTATRLGLSSIISLP